MVFRTRHLIKKELKELNRVLEELEDVEKRTEISINILKKISSNLEQSGEFEKAKALKKEIDILQKEIYEDEQAEKLARLVKEKLPKILKGKF